MTKYHSMNWEITSLNSYILKHKTIYHSVYCLATVMHQQTDMAAQNSNNKMS